jgi:chemotaxis methyl-accepting protein methylase
MIDDESLEAAVGQVGELLDARMGLRPESSLRGRLRRSIRDEVSSHGEDLAAYLLTLAQDGERLQSLVNRVTVQESGFFRHPNHFEVLATRVLPVLDRPVTIWSAGCANGQEAYSLAMLLDEQGVAGSVLATDLSTAALRRTVRATYTTRETAGVSPGRRSRYLAPHGDLWQVTGRVRSRVTSFRHNLITGLPAQVGLCQVVFCRNVLIYFSAEHARTFLDRLADALPPGAFLFLGGAESLWQVTDRFRAVRLGDSFVHQRCEVASPPVVGGAQGAPPRAAPVAGRRLAVDVATRRLRRPAVQEAMLAPQAVVAADAGRDAFAAEDHAAAVVAFRKWVYLAPDDPLAALHLGLALEAGGHRVAARRAFGVSRSAMHRIGLERTEVALGGYAAEELLRLLDTKQQGDLR